MKKYNGWQIVALSAIILLFPGTVLACDPGPYARGYINDIHKVFGGVKPELTVEKGSDNEIVAFYNKETGIHIFKNDYNGNCADNLPYLKSIIAHEYAHHISSKLKKVAWITGRENIANVGEHVIAEVVWKGEEIYFDENLDQKYNAQYKKMLKFAEEKIAKQK